MERGTATLLYDEDCGFCRWSSDVLRRWDRHRTLRFTSIQSKEGDALLAALAPERRLTSWHLVDHAGRVWSSGAAFPRLFDLLPFGRPIAWAARLSPRTTERVYAFLVRHRSRLGTLLGADRCAVDPSRGAARIR